MKAGLFGIGLDAYWEQFEGLEDRLKGYLAQIEKQLTDIHPDIVNAGLVDTVDKAFSAGSFFRKQEVDIIFLYVTTYALSSTVLPVVQRTKVPVIILNLSPADAIDYEMFNSLGNRTAMTGEWLAWCNACPVPEIANVFRRVGIQFHQVSGTINSDDSCWLEIREWLEAAKTANVLFNNRMGCMGHYYSGMLDIYTDLTALAGTFGGHFELIETDELTRLSAEVTPSEIRDRIDLFRNEFEIREDCRTEDLETAAATSVALDRLVKKYSLGSMAYYYKGTGLAANETTMSAVILGCSLLTARGVPAAGEYEIKNAIAMKIMDAFGCGGSFTEFYAMDYKDDIVLMGHDGPGHIAIAEGKTRVRPLEVYHGKVGRGLSVEMSVKYGPVTLLSVIESSTGGFSMLVAEGESVHGPILKIGNTNSRYRFKSGARKFVNEWNSYGPAHHCAVGVGHISPKLEKLAALLGIGCNIIGK